MVISDALTKPSSAATSSRLGIVVVGGVVVDGMVALAVEPVVDTDEELP